MKNYLLILTVSILSFTSFVNAQNTLKNDTLYLAKGGYLIKGQQLKLGKGAKDDGYFKNIEVNAGSMMRAYNTGGHNWGVQQANALSNQFNDLEAKIIRFEERGTKRTGKKYIAIIGVGDMKRYQVDIDNAANDGEIIIEGYALNNKVKETNSTTISLTDELKKLKDLFDSGILTEEEYNKAKAKILDKL